MANQNEKGFKSGMIAGLEIYGRVCGKQANCEQCPVGSIRGTGVTCQDFAKQFPAKMLSILQEMDEGQLTFFEEYCTRFPNCNLSVEELAQIMCRKACFEGYCACEKEGQDCVDCWNETYVSDITEVDETTEGE